MSSIVVLLAAAMLVLCIARPAPAAGREAARSGDARNADSGSGVGEIRACRLVAARLR
jgi:hypothetical protein